MQLNKKFSEADLERIKAAVREAESKISGEIVPVIVARSGYYSIANYKGGLFGATLAFLFLIVFDRYSYTIEGYNPSITVHDPILMFVVVILVGILGAVAAHFSDTVKRMLVGQQHMDHATKQRAENAFLEEEIFNTKHRTGIMIFISFMEHEVIVMADRGISKVVDQREWDKMVNSLTENIRKGRMVDGLEAALKRCGEILLEKGFHKEADDENELRDDLRIN